MKLLRGIGFDLPIEELMRFAVAEARLADWRVRPNPKVGAALLTTDGTLVADHHKQVGENHAEAEVLAACRAAGLDVRGARMAVTLEPCSHRGRTDPCADALIAAGIREVAVGVEDPFLQVRGRGIAALEAAGIAVERDVLVGECEEINCGWLAAQRLGRPFVRAKMATSLDGRWAAENGYSRWITRPAARLLGHALRGRSDLIVTGRGTVERDDPELTVRDANGQPAPYQPRVNVLTRSNDFRLEGRKLASHPRGAAVVTATDLATFLKDCFAQRVNEIHLEAGPRLTQAFLEAGLVDELHLFMAPKLLGGSALGLSPAFAGGALPGLELEVRRVENTWDGDLYLVLIPALRCSP